MTLINVFVERYIMNITAFMISYHHSVLVLTIYDLRAIHLNYLHCLELHKNLFYLDVCLNMCSSAIRYAWFCRSICIDVMSIKKANKVSSIPGSILLYESIVDIDIDTSKVSSIISISIFDIYNPAG